LGCVNLTAPQVKVVDSGAGGEGGSGGDMAEGPPEGPPDGPMVDGGDGPDDGAGGAVEGGAGEVGDHPGTDRGPEVGKARAGAACDDDGDCDSGFCSDRVCCGSRCGDRCFACNLPGREGTCTAVAVGEDPRQECDQHPEAGCGQDGTCNGAGACALYASGRQCGSASCSGTTETAASTCDGRGLCQAGTSRSCPGGLACQGSSCASSCTSDASCGAGFFCETGTCRSRRARGAACTTPAQCQDGFCVDGTCCGTACTDLCQVCNLAGALGTCTPVPNGSDPRNVCAPQATACQRDGQCDGRGACRLQLLGTSCGTATCNGAVLNPPAACDGVGTCRPATPRSCGAYLCSGAACGTACTSSTQCNVGFACSAGSCVALPGPVLHWRFDEAGGGQALDSSPSGIIGTYTGLNGMPAASVMVPPAIVPNPASRSFARSGRHAVRVAPLPAALKPSTTFTISAWYRTTALDTGAGGFMGSEVVSGGDSYILRVRSTDIEFTRVATESGGGANFGRCFMTVPNRLDGNWHHLVAVLDAGEMRGYFDGVLACSSAVAASAMKYDRGTDFWVGRHGNGGDNYDFDGNIDDVRMYARALSAAEIAAIAAGKY
jgi:hypothetical protein